MEKRLPEIRVTFSTKGKAADKPQVKSSKDAYDILMQVFDPDLLEYQEIFYALYLNRWNRLIGYKCISIGGLYETTVDSRHIVGIALKCNAKSIILSHSHPSGNVTPSKPDIDMTKKMAKGANYLDVDILDHIIVNADGEYSSMADEGLL